MKRNKEVGKKRLLVPGLVLLTLLLFCYFLYLNFPKLRYAIDFNKRIKQMPPAVNLRILKGDMPLFRKSFVGNLENIHIAAHFNVSNHLKANEEDIIFFVNGQPFTRFTLFRFKNFRAVLLNKFIFVFTGSDYGIKEIVELEKHSSSLFKLLTVKTIGGEAGKVYYSHETSGIALKHEAGKKSSENVSLALPVTFKQGSIYELNFSYMKTGDAIPKLVLTHRSQDENVLYSRYLLYHPPGSGFRQASILFSPRRDIPSAKVILSRIKRKGIVYYRKISVYRYPGTGTRPTFLTKPKIIYDDFYQKISAEYIDKKYYGCANPEMPKK